MNSNRLQGLLLNYTAIFYEVSCMLKRHGTNQHLIIFFKQLEAECTMLQTNLNDTTCGSPRESSPRAVNGILRTLETIIDLPSASPDAPMGERLAEFQQIWKSGSDETTKLQLACQHVRIKVERLSKSDRRNFRKSLAEYVRLTEASDSDDSSWAYSSLMSNNEEEPLHQVSAAAHSTYKALEKCKACPCKPPHGLGARLRLATYKRNDIGNDTDSSLQFETFLSAKNGWKEALIQTGSEVPQQLQSTSQQITKLCNEMNHTSNIIRLKFKVEQDKLYRLENGTGSPKAVIDSSKDALSLQGILRRENYLSEKAKRILALILGSAVLHLYGTPWIHSTWNSESIVFFPTDSSCFYLRPFIDTRISEEISSGSYDGWALHDDWIEVDAHDGIQLREYNCPIFVALAIILMEIYFATSFDAMVIEQGYTVEHNPQSIQSARSLLARHVFERRQSQISDQYRFVIQTCLKPDHWEDSQNTSLRAKIYEHIVRPLESELRQACDDKSIDTLNTLDTIAEGLKIFESGPSIAPSNRSELQRGSGPTGQPFFFDDRDINQTASDAMHEQYSRWMEDYKEVYLKFIQDQLHKSERFRRIKIAVLDTGVDLNHRFVRRKRIKGGYNWLDVHDPTNFHDTNGHGTSMACLLQDYAPDADLYVAKISDKEPAGQDVIARAINHATNEWNVDIISMSFGYEQKDLVNYNTLLASLQDAAQRGVLLFAAASNSGARLPRAFPAREYNHVIACHATNFNGKRCDFSPEPFKSTKNFSTIGEAVKVAWLRSNDPGAFEYRSGTSYATPIMAGIAAFLLTYGRLRFPAEAECMKSLRIMELLLGRVAQRGPELALPGGYYWIQLSRQMDNLFGSEESYIDKEIIRIINS